MYLSTRTRIDCHQPVRIVAAALDEIKEVISVGRVLFRGGANPQQFDLHPVTQVMLAANLEPVRISLGP